MKINIDIETGNSAFWNTCEDSENPTFEYSEVARILKSILPRIEISDFGKANDINGNMVATFTVERDDVFTNKPDILKMTDKEEVLNPDGSFRCYRSDTFDQSTAGRK